MYVPEYGNIKLEPKLESLRFRYSISDYVYILYKIGEINKY